MDLTPSTGKVYIARRNQTAHFSCLRFSTIKEDDNDVKMAWVADGTKPQVSTLTRNVRREHSR